VPLSYSNLGFSPSNYFLWASSASELLEHGLRSLRTLSSSRQCFRKIRVRALLPRNFSGQQCLRNIQVQASVPRISFFEPAVPLHYLGMDVRTLETHLYAADALILFEYGLMPFRTSFSGYQRSSFNMPKSWWQYTSSDAVCQIRR
jgi:hypothetical protein